MVLMISYDLKAPGRDYRGLIEAINLKGSACRVMESLWLLDTSFSSQPIYDALSHHIDSDDKLFVIRVSENWWSCGLPGEVITWLSSLERSW